MPAFWRLSEVGVTHFPKSMPSRQRFNVCPTPPCNPLPVKCQCFHTCPVAAVRICATNFPSNNNERLQRCSWLYNEIEISLLTAHFTLSFLAPPIALHTHLKKKSSGPHWTQRDCDMSHEGKVMICSLREGSALQNWWIFGKVSTMLHSFPFWGYIWPQNDVTINF